MRKIAIVLGCLLYVVSPIDLAPDFLPVIGQLDDLGVIALTVQALLRKEERAGRA